MTQMTVGLLHDGGCELGEGATYDPVKDTAFWFDIVGKKLFGHDFARSETRIWPLPFLASMLARLPDGRQMLATDSGLVIREPASGLCRQFCPIEADDAGTRSNDGRVHPSGTLWISTMGKGAEAGRGAIYAHDGQRLTRLFGGLTIPNAICFSPDGRLAYFTDTPTGRLMRVPTDPATGLPDGEVRLLHAMPGGAGHMDGAVTDAEGLIWIAMWGGGRVQALTPEAEPAGSVAVPARQPSCPAFVGPAAQGMIVTTARQGLCPAERAADPEAGHTFVLKNGFRGRHDPAFRMPG